jgi:hypothetical protein
MDKRYFVDLTSKLYRLTFFFPQKEPLRDRIREISDEILADVVVILEGEIEEKKQAAFRVEKNIKILDVLLELAKLQNWIEEDKIETVKSNYLLIKREVEELNDITRRNMKFLEPKTFLSEKETPQSNDNTRHPDDSTCHSDDSTRHSDNYTCHSREGGNPFTEEEIDSRLRGNDNKERGNDIKANENDNTRHSERSEESQPKTTSEKLSISKRQERILKIIKEQGKIQVKDIEPKFPDVTKRTIRRDVSELAEKKMIKRIGKANKTFYEV